MTVIPVVTGALGTISKNGNLAWEVNSCRPSLEQLRYKGKCCVSKLREVAET